MLKSEAVRQSREAMRTGSLSFFFASRFLPASARNEVRMLYIWCRHCDDVVDRAGTAASAAERTVILDELRRKTWEAVRVRAPRPLPAEPAFAALAELARQRPFPESYLQELLTGMEMDIEGRRYDTLEDLKVYCYRVAGVVGLMFTHIVGVTDERAFAHAADLGMAMQMTNIARDVLDDKALGRLYLPRQWLSQEDLCEQTAYAPEKRLALARVVDRLLTAADAHYRSGDQGLRYLPARTALAVAVARHIYAAIGTLVRRRGERGWDRRAVVPLARKVYLLGAGTRLVLTSRFLRRLPQ